MKEAIFDITNTSYREWYKKHYTQDIVKLILTGTATIEQIEKMTVDFNIYTYNEIELRNFNILDSTYDNGSLKTYDSYYRGIIEEYEISPKELTKILLNKKEISCFVIENNCIFSKDRLTIIHIPQNKELDIPNGIKKIGNFCCCGYEELSKLALHDGLKEIGDFAFYSSELKNLSLPDTVNKLGESCFELSEIETLKLSPNIVSIPDMCFAYAEISELKIPKSVKNIGYGAFHCCVWLECLKIPEGVESIKGDAFALPIVVFLPSTLKHIAQDFFYEECIDDPNYPPYINMHPDNPIFYSKDGSLYYKTNDKLVLEHKYNGIDPRKEFTEIPSCLKVN